MDSAKLNDWLQVVGIFALVASLIFVGMQMRQAQRIAVADSYQQQAGTSLAKSELAVMHSEVVAKANRGEALSDAEVFELTEYVTARWQHAYFGRMRSEYLERGTSGPLLNFSGLLCSNPGLRKFWNSQSEGMKANPQGGALQIFAEDVDSLIESRCDQ
jgi:hypothetical protein